MQAPSQVLRHFASRLRQAVPDVRRSGREAEDGCDRPDAAAQRQGTALQGPGQGSGTRGLNINESFLELLAEELRKHLGGKRPGFTLARTVLSGPSHFCRSARIGAPEGNSERPEGNEGNGLITGPNLGAAIGLRDSVDRRLSVFPANSLFYKFIGYCFSIVFTLVHWERSDARPST
jgi:hypothetical protein